MSEKTPIYYWKDGTWCFEGDLENVIARLRGAAQQEGGGRERLRYKSVLLGKHMPIAWLYGFVAGMAAIANWGHPDQQAELDEQTLANMRKGGM